MAAENGHDKMILLLLDNDANIAMEDAYGRNFLELAILSHQRSEIELVYKFVDNTIFVIASTGMW